MSWLLDAVRRNAPDLHVFYSLDGQVADGRPSSTSPGTGTASRSVRATPPPGRPSSGTYGDLFDTAAATWPRGTSSTRQPAGCWPGWPTAAATRWTQRGLRHLGARRSSSTTRSPRSAAGSPSTGPPGWPTRTSSPAPARARWRAEAAEIRRWVDAHCWSEAKQAYTFYAGTDDLDAAVLLAGRTGFDRGPRLASTIDAVTAELGRGPLVYRYTGMDAEEGAFVACTFWLVDALVQDGPASTRPAT